MNSDILQINTLNYEVLEYLLKNLKLYIRGDRVSLGDALITGANGISLGSLCHDTLLQGERERKNSIKLAPPFQREV